MLTPEFHYLNKMSYDQPTVKGVRTLDFHKLYDSTVSLANQPMNWQRRFNSKSKLWCCGVSEMRTLFYIFAICLAAILLFVTVDRVERNRPLAILLMILILGATAAAVLKHLMP
jgi:hypothetical protein